MTDYIAEAIEEAWGERCPEFNPECHCCRAWKQYDDLKASASRAKDLAQDNERLRWRHPMVLPDWNDLPNDLRPKLVQIGEWYAGETYGANLAVNFYGEVREYLEKENAA